MKYFFKNFFIKYGFDLKVVCAREQLAALSITFPFLQNVSNALGHNLLCVPAQGDLEVNRLEMIQEVTMQ